MGAFEIHHVGFWVYTPLISSTSITPSCALFLSFYYSLSLYLLFLSLCLSFCLPFTLTPLSVSLSSPLYLSFHLYLSIYLSTPLSLAFSPPYFQLHSSHSFPPPPPLPLDISLSRSVSLLSPTVCIYLFGFCCINLQLSSWEKLPDVSLQGSGRISVIFLAIDWALAGSLRAIFALALANDLPCH